MLSVVHAHVRRTCRASLQSCTGPFLVPLLASNVEIAGLQRLASDCTFTADNVPECLVDLLGQLGAPVDAAEPPVTATQGGPGGLNNTTPPGAPPGAWPARQLVMRLWAQRWFQTSKRRQRCAH
eukprot:365720-Chlamydomonas_euryale.AAC.21